MKKWSRYQQKAYYFNPLILKATTVEAIFRLLMLGSLGLAIISSIILIICIGKLMYGDMGVLRMMTILLYPLVVFVFVRVGYMFSAFHGVVKVQQAGYKLCNHCRYNLNDLGNSDKCPECGNDYEYSDLQAYWKSCYPAKFTEITYSSADEPSNYWKGVKLSWTRAKLSETTLLTIVLVATVILLLVPLPREYIGEFWAMSINCGLTLVIICLWIAYYLVRRSSRKLIKEEKYLLCLHCRYSLNGLPEEAKCPECGNDYKISKVQEYWKLCYNETSKKYE